MNSTTKTKKTMATPINPTSVATVMAPLYGAAIDMVTHSFNRWNNINVINSLELLSMLLNNIKQNDYFKFKSLTRLRVYS